MSNNFTSTDNFEEKLAQIQAVLTKLNDDKTTLKESIELFKQGSLIARDASELLAKAELEIEQFKQGLASGFGAQLASGAKTQNISDDKNQADLLF